MQTAMGTEEKQLGEGKYDHLKISEGITVQSRPNIAEGGWDCTISMRNLPQNVYFYLDKALEAYTKGHDLQDMSHFGNFNMLLLDIVRDRLIADIRKNGSPNYAK